jgi:hypothetical protein
MKVTRFSYSYIDILENLLFIDYKAVIFSLCSNAVNYEGFHSALIVKLRMECGSNFFHVSYV